MVSKGFPNVTTSGTLFHCYQTHLMHFRYPIDYVDVHDIVYCTNDVKIVGVEKEGRTKTGVW